jgi:hypothetical protein
LDAEHALWVEAGVDLKTLVVSAIGAEHFSTVASTHTNGALRNCSALFIMEWLESEHGTIESQHATERLAALDVALASSDQWPAHAAAFTTTIRRLRVAERLPSPIPPFISSILCQSCWNFSFPSCQGRPLSLATFKMATCNTRINRGHVQNA